MWKNKFEEALLWSKIKSNIPGKTHVCNFFSDSKYHLKESDVEDHCI